MNNIDADGLYLYNEPAELDITTLPSALDQYNAVIVSTANVNLKNTDDYFKPQKSVVIIAPIITFAPNVREAKGIY